jgi:hypothetical protein
MRSFLVYLAGCNGFRIRDVLISFPEEGFVCRCGHRLIPIMIRYPNPFSQMKWTCKKTGTISTSTTTSSKSTTTGETREEGRSDIIRILKQFRVVPKILYKLFRD